MNYVKKYLQVLAAFDPEGRIVPVMFYWTDGRKYRIDKVLDVKPASAMKCGGQGDRYTIRVMGKERYIFLEHDPDLTINRLRWFVEAVA